MLDSAIEPVAVPVIVTSSEATIPTSAGVPSIVTVPVPAVAPGLYFADNPETVNSFFVTVNV